MPQTTAQSEKAISASRNSKGIGHSRTNPIALYLVCLACTFLAYCLYAKYAVPIIEGPPTIVKRRPVSDIADLSRPINDHSNLDYLFPADAWELGQCKTLETSQGTLLFQDFQTQPDGYVDVFPFTMVMTDDKDKTAESTSKPRAHPIVLRCANKARLKFDQPVSLGGLGQKKSNQAQKLVSARLVGQVMINRLAASSESNDEIAILTSNVQITTDQIFTLEMVDFKFGKNRGRGRNLTIDLIHSEHANSVTRDFSNVQGIRRLELAFLNELRIEPGQDSERFIPPTETPVAKRPADQNKLLSGNKVPLRLSCDGAFIFDFEKKLATFRKNVNVQQLDQFGDNIQCELMTLVFFDDSDSAVEKAGNTTNAEGENDANPDLKIKRLIAEGNPATLISNSQKARITGDFLAYNLINENLVARSETSVSIINAEMNLKARRLNYTPNADGSIGNLSADGPGKLIRTGKTPDDEFMTSWAGRLTIQKDAAVPGRKILLIDKQASIRMASTSHIDADRLKFWFWETESESQPIDQPAPKDSKRLAGKMIPAQLLAAGNVDIKSPTLSGQTNELTAEWPAERPANAKIGLHQPKRAYQAAVRVGKPQLRQTQLRQTQLRQTQLRQTQLRQAQQNDYRNAELAPIQLTHTQTQTQSQTQSQSQTHLDGQVVRASFNQPVQQSLQQRPQRITNQFSTNQQNTKGLGRQRHMNFVGDRVLLKFDSYAPDAQPTHVDIAGNVEINETGKSPGTKPLRITGERLLITPLAKDLNEMAITGSASQQAMVVAEGLQLVGQDIFVNQLENKLWVEGAGNLKIKQAAPKSLKPTVTAGQQPAPAKKDAAQTIDVGWGRGMIFERDKIYFEQDVVMSSSRTGGGAALAITGGVENKNRPAPSAKSGSTQTKTLSQGLTVYLSQPVDFAKLSGDQKVGNIEVRRVSMVDTLESRVFQNASFASNTNPAQPAKVVVESRSLDVSGKTKEFQRMMVARADVDATTGEIFATGPGKIINHRSGKSSLGFGTPGSGDSRASNNGPPANGPAEISALQMNFDGTLAANANENKMNVEGNVRVMNASVKSWDQAYDPDQTTRIPKGGVKLVCDKITVEQWTPRASQQPTSEMIATGNTHIWGDLFEATADRVSYNQANDTLTIAGTSRTDAKLWHQSSPTASRGEPLVAGKLLYRPSNQSFKILRVKSASIKQSGNLFGGQK